MKHVIIGAGPAGLNAAATLRQVDSGGVVTLFSGEATPPYAKMVLPYLLSGVMEEKNLYLPVPEGVNFRMAGESSGSMRSGRQLRPTTGRLWSTTSSSLPQAGFRNGQPSKETIIP